MGLSFINDSKGTNIESTRYALASFKDIIWIAGGIAKEEGFESLLEETYRNIKHAYLIGSAAEKIAQALTKFQVPYTISTSLENALSAIFSNTYSKATVLLSPACSSFDQWKNFEERGNAFKSIVLNH